MLPFKWNLFSKTSEEQYLFVKLFEKEIWLFFRKIFLSPLIFPCYSFFLRETTAQFTSTQRATQFNLDKLRDIYCPISSILFSIEIQV